MPRGNGAFFYVWQDKTMTTSLRQPTIASDLREQWKKWILFQLGHPVVKVEITNNHLDIAIDEAVRRFSQWAPAADKLLIFDAIGGESVYDLTYYIPDYISVRDVIYHPSVTDMLLTNFIGGVTTDFSFGSNQISYFHGTYSSMIDFTLWNMYNEQYLRTIGREGMWQIIEHNLILSPAPSVGVKVGIIYNTFLIDEDIRRDEWIKEWALTEVKMALGRIRSKYVSLPGPRGQDITMDGTALIQEAREDREKLLERINEYREPIGWEIG